MSKRLGQASAVRASGPTARPSQTTAHLIDADRDAAYPGAFFFCRCDPTDPLVSRKRSDFGPEALCGDVGLDGVLEI
jgi:hypothetical protein